jgi:hypothetical protein
MSVFRLKFSSRQADDRLLRLPFAIIIAPGNLRPRESWVKDVRPLTPRSEKIGRATIISAPGRPAAAAPELARPS